MAKFIIIDADRLVKHYEEKNSFLQLAEFCKLQNKKGTISHFLIVNNPNFEYATCLHVPEYKGQEVTRFLQTVLGFQSLEQFKKNTEVYECLNNGARSYQVLVQKVQNKDKFVKNTYWLMPDKDKFLDCQKYIEKDFCICYNAYRQKRCKKSTLTKKRIPRPYCNTVGGFFFSFIVAKHPLG